MNKPVMNMSVTTAVVVILVISLFFIPFCDSKAIIKMMLPPPIIETHSSSLSSSSSSSPDIKNNSSSAVEGPSKRERLQYNANRLYSPDLVLFPDAETFPTSLPLVGHNGHRNGHHKTGQNAYNHPIPGGQYYQNGQYYPSPYTSESSISDNGKNGMDSWFSISPLKVFIIWISVVLGVSAYITWKMYYPERSILPNFCCGNNI